MNQGGQEVHIPEYLKAHSMVVLRRFISHYTPSQSLYNILQLDDTVTQKPSTWAESERGLRATSPKFNIFCPLIFHPATSYVSSSLKVLSISKGKKMHSLSPFFSSEMEVDLLHSNSSNEQGGYPPMSPFSPRAPKLPKKPFQTSLLEPYCALATWPTEYISHGVTSQSSDSSLLREEGAVAAAVANRLLELEQEDLQLLTVTFLIRLSILFSHSSRLFSESPSLLQSPILILLLLRSHSSPSLPLLLRLF